jgi:mannose PTS system EIIA component
MIGMVLVTHGNLAEEFVHAMEHVVGDQAGVAMVCIGPNDDMEARRTEISDKIAAVNEGEGVIVLTDLFGGTPSNLAISLMQAGVVEVIAGINLPMLIRLAKARRCMPLREAAAAARDAGRNYITIASEYLGQDA